jgi:hypothetical protein
MSINRMLIFSCDDASQDTRSKLRSIVVALKISPPAMCFSTWRGNICTGTAGWELEHHTQTDNIDLTKRYLTNNLNCNQIKFCCGLRFRVLQYYIARWHVPVSDADDHLIQHVPVSDADDHLIQHVPVSDADDHLIQHVPVSDADDHLIQHAYLELIQLCHD